jgi:hypothetical protein
LPSLLLGAGHSRQKKVWLVDRPEWVLPLVTLDMGTDCGADVVWDLDNRPLPFPDEHFDELAAYDVLEHIGKQGDWRGWFDEFAEYWRILKPGGFFGIIVPIGWDYFADPGHTRFIHVNHFGFLCQAFYEDNLKKGTAVTDYRWFWKKNFDIAFMENQGHHLCVMLKKA